MIFRAFLQEISGERNKKVAILHARARVLFRTRKINLYSTNSMLEINGPLLTDYTWK